jgi:hypothetical protein
MFNQKSEKPKACKAIRPQMEQSTDELKECKIFAAATSALPAITDPGAALLKAWPISNSNRFGHGF